MALERTNRCYFVGELVEVKDHRLTTYTDKKTGEPREAVSTTIVVKCMDGENENLHSLSAFCNKTNKDGSTNKNYNKLVNIKDLLNKKVVISGATIVGDRFWSRSNNQLVPAQKFNFSIIREANLKEIEGGDKAEFEFGGFVVRELKAKTDKEDNIMYYQMTLGQSNYKEDNMSMVDFIVEKDNVKAIKAIENNYPQFTTISIHGLCKNVVTTETVEEESLFGEPIVKVYTHNDKKLVILGGQEPITGEGEYTSEAITSLNKAFTAEGEEIKNRALSNSNDSVPASKPTTTAATKKTALAGMFD